MKNILAKPRGVWFIFSDGDIIIFLKEKIGQYKLSGGGKENNEKPEKPLFVKSIKKRVIELRIYKKLGLQMNIIRFRMFLLLNPMVV